MMSLERCKFHVIDKRSRRVMVATINSSNFLILHAAFIIDVAITAVPDLGRVMYQN